MKRVVEENSDNSSKMHNISNQRNVQDLTTIVINRKIEKVEKIVLTTVDNSLAGLTFWNCLSMNDIHKDIFKRWVDTIANAADQQLLRLRGISKYFKEQIDSVVLGYIETEYPSGALTPFSILGAAEKTNFNPCFNLSLHRASVLNWYAANNLQNTACNDYTELFQGFQEKVNHWTAKCSRFQFSYELVEGILDSGLSIYCCRVKTDNEFIRLKSQIAKEAYLVSKFLEAYIENQQFIDDFTDKEKRIKLLKLLHFFNSYQSYGGIDVILCTLVSKIEQNSNEGKFDVSTSFDFFGELLRENIVASQPCLNALLSVCLANLNNGQGQVKAFEILSDLLNRNVVVPKEVLSQLLRLAIENVTHKQLQIRIDALWLLSVLINTGMIIPAGDFTKLMPLVIENLQHSNEEMQGNAQSFVYEIVSKGMMISEELLNQVLLAVIAQTKSANWEIQKNALGLLNQFLIKGIAKTKDDLSKLFQAIKNIKYADKDNKKTPWQVVTKVFELFSRLTSKGMIIPEEDFKLLLPAMIGMVNHLHWPVRVQSQSLLSDFINQGIVIPDNLLISLLPAVFENVQHLQSRVQENALGLISDCLMAGVAIPDDFLKTLAPLCIKNVNQTPSEVRFLWLLLLADLLRSGFAIKEEEFKELLLKAIDNLNAPQMEVQQNALLLIFELFKQDVEISADSLNKLIHLTVECLKSSHWEVQLNALWLLCRMLNKGIVISGEPLAKLQVFTMETLKQGQWHIQSFSLVLLSQIVAQDVFLLNVPENLVKSLHSVVETWNKKNTELEPRVELEIFSMLKPVFLLLNRHLDNKFIEISQKIDLLIEDLK